MKSLKLAIVFALALFVFTASIAYAATVPFTIDPWTLDGTPVETVTTIEVSYGGAFATIGTLPAGTLTGTLTVDPGQTVVMRTSATIAGQTASCTSNPYTEPHTVGGGCAILGN